MTDVKPFIDGLLAETRDEINRADGKANILLAISGVGVAALAGGFVSADLTLNGEPGMVQVLAGLAVVILAIGLVLLSLAALPRIGKATKGRARYFMDHAQYDDLAQFRTAIQHEAQRADERHLRQLLDLSRIVRRKYRLTQIGEVHIGLGFGVLAAAAVAHHLMTG